jgi:hypothetical protein
MKDDRLILYYYDDDLSAAEKRAIAAALEQDPALAKRYRALIRDLGGMTEAPGIAAPADLRARLHATLDRVADLERDRVRDPRHRSHWFAFFLGAGLTAAFALAIGVALRPDATPELIPTDTIADTGTEIAAGDDTARGGGRFTRALQVHFRDSRRDLQGLADAGNGERTALIMNLVEQNRAFARLAVRNDATDLARVLRAFEPILMRLAAEDVTAEESEALRAQLAFELNVMLTKLTRETSEFATTTQQESTT